MSFRNFRGRSGGFRRRFSGMRPMVNTLKIETNAIVAVAASTNEVFNAAIAVDSPATASSNQVKNGSRIKAFWYEFWYYGLSAGNTNDIFDMYVIKNPGNNLTPPNPGTVGTSNEKKFIFKQWRGLLGNKSLGGSPYGWRGWIKIPKRYQRFGTDDRLSIITRSPTTGNLCQETIMKYQF